MKASSNAGRTGTTDPDATESGAAEKTALEAVSRSPRKLLGVKPAGERATDEVKRTGLRARFLTGSERLRPPPAAPRQTAPSGTPRPGGARAKGPRVEASRSEGPRGKDPRPEPRGKPAPDRPASPRAARPVRKDGPAAGASAKKPRSPASPTSRAPGAQDKRPSPPPRPAATSAEGVRLSKVMAERGLCSRREADAIIERGWVFVDGRRVSELGIRIDPGAQITLAPEAMLRQASQVTILLHKPVGYVSGQPEPGYEPAVSLIGGGNQFDRETAQRFHASHLRGLAPAGRLDIDSTGLLVLTQDGRIARQLIGDDSKIDKEYLVRVEGRLDAEGLALLNHGLELDGRKLRPAKVEWVNDDQLRFVLREGRKRQIRRMCELVGLKVVGLKRVRIGRVRLGDLPLGQWRFLREDERF